MEQNNKSVSKISETMLVMGQLFVWAGWEDFWNEKLRNPFKVVIRNKDRFARTVKPAKQEELMVAAEHIRELPEHTQIAYLLLASTLARANDICEIRMSELQILDDGSSRWTYIAKKNKKHMAHILSPRLTGLILEYVAKTEKLRERYGEDALFLYEEPGLREGTHRLPMVLTAAAFRYQITKLMALYTDGRISLTPRSIRAEGGRRLHAQGCSEGEIAMLLGNTPATAQKHYASMTAHDEAELYHRVFLRQEAEIWGDAEETVTEESTAYNKQTLFGTCASEKTCSKKLSYRNCGMLCKKEGGTLPWQ